MLERTCTMPVGTQLFFPVVNVDIFPFAGESEAQVRDQAFYGCGVATWTAETLTSQLERRGRSPFS